MIYVYVKIKGETWVYCKDDKVRRFYSFGGNSEPKPYKTLAGAQSRISILLGKHNKVGAEKLANGHRLRADGRIYNQRNEIVSKLGA